VWVRRNKYLPGTIEVGESHIIEQRWEFLYRVNLARRPYCMYRACIYIYDRTCHSYVYIIILSCFCAYVNAYTVLDGCTEHYIATHTRRPCFIMRVWVCVLCNNIITTVVKTPLRFPILLCWLECRLPYRKRSYRGRYIRSKCRSVDEFMRRPKTHITSLSSGNAYKHWRLHIIIYIIVSRERQQTNERFVVDRRCVVGPLSRHPLTIIILIRNRIMTQRCTAAYNWCSWPHDSGCRWWLVRYYIRLKPNVVMVGLLHW